MRTWPVMLVAAILLAPVQPAPGEGGARAGDLGIYHTYDEMVSELENLTAAHPDILSLESIGRTYEGRELWVVKLSDNVTADESEPNITIFGGIHAGELIGVEVALSILRSLVENYTTNSTIGWYVNSTQLWFLPMLNPDGHVYVEQGNLWRKNRSPNPGGTFGKDLNRNFGHLWGLQASHNPPDDDYCGPYAFSENETQAVRKLVTDHHPDITISYHAYGQYILYPWGNTINQEPVDPRLSQIAWNMSFAMPEGRRYMPMFAREMYAATGDTDDYFYMNLSVLPFTIELTTSFRPLDSAVPGICADNLGPVLYVLNYTVGAPPPPPPRRSIAIDGPDTFNTSYLDFTTLNFTLNNTGELREEISLSLNVNNTLWRTNGTMLLGPENLSLGPGESQKITVMLKAPFFPPDTPVEFRLDAAAASGAGCSRDFTGYVDRVRWPWAYFSNTDGLQVSPGQSIDGLFCITNAGNVPETIEMSCNLSLGSYEGSLPGQLTIEAGGVMKYPLVLHVPDSVEAGTAINFSWTFRSADGEKGGQNWLVFHVGRIYDIRLIAASRNVTLKERETAAIEVRLENHGNVWQNGTLMLGGNDTFCGIENDRFNLSPYSNATTTVYLRGKKGSWALEITFEGGLPTIQETIFYNVTTNGTGVAPPYDYRYLVFGVITAAIVTAALVLWWRYIYVPARRRGRDGT